MFVICEEQGRVTRILQLNALSLGSIRLDLRRFLYQNRHCRWMTGSLPSEDGEP
jgi:hypothetical protein